MSQHFRTAAPEQNSILRHAAVRYRARHAAATRCVLRIWSRALETVGPWYADLAGTSLVGAQAIPVTVVNASELAATGTSSGPEQDGTWTTDLIPEHPQWDPLSDLAGNRENGRWAGPVGGTVPELLRSRYRETVRADRRAGRPVASIRLPAVDEFYLGQLMQLLMLATTIEERLLRSDANGRPEVQALDNHLTLTGI